MKANIAVYWDVQNGITSSSKIQHLYQWLIQTGDLLISNAYAYWKIEDEQFQQTLSEIGMDMINVFPTGKNAVDKRIIQDCKKQILSDRSIRTVILITGDKGFSDLVHELKNLGVSVILIWMNNAAKRLQKAVDYDCHIDELIDLINFNEATPEKLDSSTILPYEEGKNYLIYLIKTDQAKGKKVTLASMGRLIKNHPQLSGSKKVSYCKPDGKTVSKFSKFVEAVIREGIIQKNCNGELILV